MRKFTQLMLTLALMIVGVGEVNAEEVYRVVYSSHGGSYPWYVMGYTPTYVDGIMTDDGKNQDPAVTGWHQYFIADGIPTVAGNDYVVKALVRCNGYFDLTVNMGWGWNDGESKGASVHLTPTDDFVWVEWSYKGIGGTSCNLVAQPWSGNTKFEFKELAVYTADPQYIPTYGDLHTVTPHIYAKNAGEGSGTSATPDGEGVYTVTSVDDAGAADWATQFWIASPEQGLPAGQTFYVEFEYKAEHAADAYTQTQLKENDGYKTNKCVGEGESKSDLSFTTEWKSIKKTVTIENDMDGWRSIAFCLNKDKTANKYYFRNIVLKVPELTSAKIDFSVGAAEWASYSSAYNVDLGATEGYAAKYNGSYVELIPVTEVPANNAVLIEGKGKHSFDVIASAAAITENELQVSDGTVSSDGTHHFALGKNGDEVGFMKIKSGVTIPKGKAYLYIATPPSAREFIGFDEDEVSGIELVEQNVKADKQYYNLAGQPVDHPTNGIYIVDGKKVIINE